MASDVLNAVNPVKKVYDGTPEYVYEKLSLSGSQIGEFLSRVGREPRHLCSCSPTFVGILSNDIDGFTERIVMGRRRI